MSNISLLDSGKRTIQLELQAIGDLAGSIDQSFCRACDIILACEGRVVVVRNQLAFGALLAGRRTLGGEARAVERVTSTTSKTAGHGAHHVVVGRVGIRVVVLLLRTSGFGLLGFLGLFGLGGNKTKLFGLGGKI